MAEFLEHIRTHFNIIHKGDYLSLTLINPNISVEIMKDIKDKFKLVFHIRRQEITILQTANFDDELLTVLAESLPHSLVQLSLDFTGCESLKGAGFLELFEKLSKMDNLTKLHLDFSQVYDINDFVIEGLSMLLETLNGLKDFYLDLYEVDQISEDGYLMLAESLSHLSNLEKLHVDLSANPALTEDALELMFSSFPSSLTTLGFRILDIEHIGGGSFFKLAQSISEMKQLQTLNLTISTFSNLNIKGLYSVIKSIGSLSALETININFSNVGLPQKMLSYFTFPQSLQNLSIDVSCNTNLSDRDLICLTNKIPVAHKLKSVSFNFDFCKRISEEAVSSLIQKVCENKSLLKLCLPDRKYSESLVNQCTRIIQKSPSHQSMCLFSCNAVNQMKKNPQLQALRLYKDKERLKRSILLTSFLVRQNKHLVDYQKDIIKMFLP